MVTIAAIFSYVAIIGYSLKPAAKTRSLNHDCEDFKTLMLFGNIKKQWHHLDNLLDNLLDHLHQSFNYRSDSSPSYRSIFKDQISWSWLLKASNESNKLDDDWKSQKLSIPTSLFWKKLKSTNSARSRFWYNLVLTDFPILRKWLVCTLKSLIHSPRQSLWTFDTVSQTI